VSASVLDDTETSADTPAPFVDGEPDAPFDVEPPVDALAVLVDAAPPVVLVLSIKNGAEKRCGLVKSC